MIRNNLREEAVKTLSQLGKTIIFVSLKGAVEAATINQNILAS